MVRLGRAGFQRYFDSQASSLLILSGSRALRRAALADRGPQISEITARLLDARPDLLHSKLRHIRSFAVSRVRNLPAILTSDITQVRAEFGKHIEKITLTPSGETYVASGTWNFVGRGSIGGAGGQNRTGYACLFRTQ